MSRATGRASCGPTKTGPRANVLSMFCDDTDGDAADHRTGRTVEPAQHGRREGEQDDAQHRGQVEEDDGSDKHASDRAYHRREGPAEHQHPADVDAHEPRRRGVLGRGAHGEAELGVVEEHVQQPGITMTETMITATRCFCSVRMPKSKVSSSGPMGVAGKLFGSSPWAQMNAVRLLKMTNKPSVTITMLSTGAPSTGRMTVRSTKAPSAPARASTSTKTTT